MSFPLRGSRRTTGAPRRTRAAALCGDERPPCGSRRITAAPLCSVGTKSSCTLLRSLWLESASGAHRVLASPGVVFFLDVVGGGRISGSKTPCGGVRDLLPLMGWRAVARILPQRGDRPRLRKLLCGCRSTNKGRDAAILCIQSRQTVQPRIQLAKDARGSVGKRFFASPWRLCAAPPALPPPSEHVNLPSGSGQDPAGYATI